MNDPFTRAALARGQFQEGVALIGDDLVPQHGLRSSRFYRDRWESVRFFNEIGPLGLQIKRK